MEDVIEDTIYKWKNAGKIDIGYQRFTHKMQKLVYTGILSGSTEEKVNNSTTSVYLLNIWLYFNNSSWMCPILSSRRLDQVSNVTDFVLFDVYWDFHSYATTLI